MKNQRDSCVETNPLTHNSVFPLFLSLLLLHLFIRQATVCVCTRMKSFVPNYVDTKV